MDGLLSKETYTRGLDLSQGDAAHAIAAGDRDAIDDGECGAQEGRAADDVICMEGVPEYQAWQDEVPVSTKEVYSVFAFLRDKFGFQSSSVANMADHFMTQLDSRASRMKPLTALVSLHASYIGGDESNYKKWYFAAQLDLDEEIGFSNMKLRGKAARRNRQVAKRKGVALKRQREKTEGETDLESDYIHNSPEYKWKAKMNALNPKEMVRQVALYLLCWGEANQMRFTPECLCFIFKCALDYDIATEKRQEVVRMPQCYYLDNIVTPLYRFLRAQVYNVDAKGGMTKRERDHKDTIGYDDINQLFWYPEGIERLTLLSGERLVDVDKDDRYTRLQDVQWEKAFYKTYKESRTWLHCATNFNRIWVIHFAVFWFYTSFNSPTLYTKDYHQLLDNQPVPAARFSAVALGGSVAALIQIIATLAEWSFVPRQWPGAQHLTKRLIGLLLVLFINTAPSVYVFWWFGLDVHSQSAYIISIFQFTFAVLTTLFFAVQPLGGLFTSYLDSQQSKRRYSSSKVFTANFPELTGRSKLISYGLWLTVFGCKFMESYFFLTLSLRDPIRVLSIIKMTRCHGDAWLGRSLCQHQAHFTLILMYMCDLVLFFLDTYLWYIIINCLFSIVLSVTLGTSLWTPWKSIYSKLPDRIYSKVLATAEMDTKYKPNILISQIWNAVIVSMYREHLLSIDHVQKLLYQQIESQEYGKKALKAPSFFVAEDDSNYKSTEYFPKSSEAQRRISFFAQSLSTPMAEPIPIECMPVFTVLVPHYSEKILLSLKEIIKEQTSSTKISLLEYLKELHPFEWDCFVRDTKLLAIETGKLSAHAEKYDTSQRSRVRIDLDEETTENIWEKICSFSPRSPNEITIIPSSIDDEVLQAKINDLPFYSVGFRNSDNQETLRTRIWASLRSQTLYRTVSGFMNYSKAIKLLYRVETPDLVSYHGNNIDGLNADLDFMAHTKFKMVVSMQRLKKFNAEEKEATEFLLCAYPDLQIAYLEEETNPQNPHGEPLVFSCLVDGFCLHNSNGVRIPKYKIRLSGNPILGDGKSDNQNHALIFYRGEYIQVIDANQDNYLEECIKIRSVLSEFEELDNDPTSPYIPGIENGKQKSPVAIVGAREYIFSENIGILGDIAAGKEQTFGTLFARTLAEIGGKLHYGHPDFLNAIFMTTRGGISKSQKGLHLNEDIYAGMTAICRGGRIKHSDYYQCGKGRDLGFGTILNFTTKIGAGMGEQMLSRDYYYLGTQLPIDRFLSFFYAHPGFHLNNLFISLSVQMFFLFMVNLGALTHESILCIYNKDLSITELEQPIGCYNLQPVLNWVTIFVFSIFIVFFMAFAPLLIQELLERGLWKAATRLIHHIVSLSPFFEVFVCQIYGHSLMTDITFGGARYMATGRGFAVSRIDFPTLYTRFASSSIYTGSFTCLMLLFSTLSIWQPAILWFWITIISLCLAPFLFNPHQFAFMEFFIDYKNYIRWLSRGNSRFHKKSWVGYMKSFRAKYTGYKKKIINDVSESSVEHSKKAGLGNVFFSELVLPTCTSACCVIAYLFINAQNGVKNVHATNSVARLLIVTILPITVNMTTLLVLFMVSCFAGPITSLCCQKSGSTIAAVAHGVSVMTYMVDFELMWLLQGWNFERTLVLLIAVISLHDVLFKFIIIFLLTREYKNDKSNIAWWSGKWYCTGMGWSALLQPSREFIVKTIESSLFAADFLLGHFLLFVQTPFVFVPYIDGCHSMILFWLQPRKQHQLRAHVFSKRQQRLRKRAVRRYICLYICVLLLILTLLIVPFLTRTLVPDIRENLPHQLANVIQPRLQFHNDTGSNAPAYVLRAAPALPTISTAAY